MPWSEAAWPDAAWLAGAALLSALGTAWARRHGQRRGLLDLPGERRSHTQPTARGGGIGIVLASLVACIWLACRDSTAWGWIAAGLAVTALVGWWDDHRPLSAWFRLCAHVVAGLLLGVALHGLGAGAPAIVLAVLATPVFINAWNFIDGIDGLAASQAALLAVGLACVLAGPGVHLFAMVVGAACLGFLPFNLPRARIFLGDVGSGALGFLAVTLGALALTKWPAVQWPAALLPASAVLVDAGLTLAWRMLRGERWWQPHVQHLYQRMARRRDHLAVTLAYGGWTTAAVAITLALQHGLGPPAWMAAVAWLGLTTGIWLHLHRRHGVATEGIGT